MTSQLGIATSKDWIHANLITINLFDVSGKSEVRAASTGNLNIVLPWTDEQPIQMSFLFNKLDEAIWANQSLGTEPEEATLVESGILQELLSEVKLTQPTDDWSQCLHDL